MRDALRLILGILVVGSKREIGTARLHFILVVKEMGGGGRGDSSLNT